MDNLLVLIFRTQFYGILSYWVQTHLLLLVRWWFDRVDNVRQQTWHSHRTGSDLPK
jgi:hypothetical protein